jgi:hypothetical protein
VIGRALALAALAAFAAVPGEAMPLGPALLPGLGWAFGYLFMLALAAMVQTRWDLEQEGRNG